MVSSAPPTVGLLDVDPVRGERLRSRFRGAGIALRVDESTWGAMLRHEGFPTDVVVLGSGAESMDVLERRIRVCRMLGCGVVVVGPGRSPDERARLEGVGASWWLEESDAGHGRDSGTAGRPGVDIARLLALLRTP